MSTGESYESVGAIHGRVTQERSVDGNKIGVDEQAGLLRIKSEADEYPVY